MRAKSLLVVLFLLGISILTSGSPQTGPTRPTGETVIVRRPPAEVERELPRQDSRAFSGAEPTNYGFFLEDVRFDESAGERKPAPRIPRDWRLLGVSNGGSVNANNLWFQDKEGTIYVVHGFTVAEGATVLHRTKFILSPVIGRIVRESETVFPSPKR